MKQAEKETTQVPATAECAPAPAPVPAPVTARRRWNRRLKWLIPLGLLAVLAAGSAYYLLVLRPDDAPIYTDYTVARSNVTRSVTETSVLESLERRAISALVPGTVVRSDPKKGQTVAQGDLLYAIDDAQARQALEQRTLALRRAEQASADAQRRVADLTVTAPVSGLVTAVHGKDGDMVPPNFILATVANVDQLTLTLPFLAQDAAQLTPGQSAAVTPEGGNDSVAATVRRVTDGTFVSSAGAQVTNVILDFFNPGAVAPGTRATAVAGDYACHQSGTIDARTTWDLRAKGTGELDGFTLVAGDRVTEGQLVATLTSPETYTALESAALAVDEAEAALRAAWETLDDYEIRAPIAGTLISKPVDVGDNIGASNMSMLAEVADLTSLRFPLDIDEMDIALVRPGQRVTVTADACPGEEYTGTVTSVDPVGSASGGVTTFPVWVQLEDYGNLRPGMNVEAHIVTAQATDTLVIPEKALMPFEDGGTVMVQRDAGAGTVGYLPVPVKTGLIAGGWVEITSGLTEGDIIGIP